MRSHPSHSYVGECADTKLSHNQTLRLAHAADVSETCAVAPEAVKLETRSRWRLVERAGTAAGDDGDYGDYGDDFLRICTHGEEGRFCRPNLQVHVAGHPRAP